MLAREFCQRIKLIADDRTGSRPGRRTATPRRLPPQRAAGGGAEGKGPVAVRGSGREGKAADLEGMGETEWGTTGWRWSTSLSG